MRGHFGLARVVAAAALLVAHSGCSRSGLEVPDPVEVPSGNNAYRVQMTCTYDAPPDRPVGISTPLIVDDTTGEAHGPPICLPPELNENLVGPGAATPEALREDCETRLIPLFATALRSLVGASEEEACAVSCECVVVEEPFNDPFCDGECDVVDEPGDPGLDWKEVTVARPLACDEVFPTDPRPVCRPPAGDPPVFKPDGALPAFIGLDSTGAVRDGVAVVTVGGKTRMTSGRGRVSFERGACSEDTCEVGMDFDLTAEPVKYSGGLFGFSDLTIENIRIGGAGEPGALSLDSTAHGIYPPGTVQAWARGTGVERGPAGRERGRTTSAFVLYNTADVVVDVDWAGKSFQVADEFSLPPGDDPEGEPARSQWQLT